MGFFVAPLCFDSCLSFCDAPDHLLSVIIMKALGLCFDQLPSDSARRKMEMILFDICSRIAMTTIYNMLRLENSGY